MHKFLESLQSNPFVFTPRLTCYGPNKFKLDIYDKQKKLVQLRVYVCPRHGLYSKIKGMDHIQETCRVSQPWPMLYCDHLNAAIRKSLDDLGWSWADDSGDYMIAAGAVRLRHVHVVPTQS